MSRPPPPRCSILRSGLMDKDGANFAPSIVRVGVKSHHSVAAVSLDTIVESRLGGGDKVRACDGWHQYCVA